MTLATQIKPWQSCSPRMQMSRMTRTLVIVFVISKAMSAALRRRCMAVCVVDEPRVIELAAYRNLS